MAHLESSPEAQRRIAKPVMLHRLSGRSLKLPCFEKHGFAPILNSERVIMNLSPIRIETSNWQEAPAGAPRQIFAIGDIHGRADLLEALHAEIRRRARPDAVVIHLGDYIDRGPWSIQALRMALDGVDGLETVCLPGNHEQFLVAALNASTDVQSEIMEAWLDNGGRAVARELHCDPTAEDARSRAKLLDAIRGALGEQRLNQLSSLPNHIYVGAYLFVHAGVNPGISIAQFLAQDWRNICLDEDLDPLWIRWPFFEHNGPYEGGVVVVHGHTPRDQPELLSNRINLDTRAFDSGRLTMAEFDNDKLRVVQTHGRSRRPGTTELE
jgi:serine/threonine protein phosphatase 1